MNNLELFVAVTMAVIVIMMAAQICGKLITAIGQPRVVGEMISGVLLGPTLFGNYFPELSANLFNKEVMSVLFVLCNLGLSIYMFLVGAEIDYKLFKKSTIKQAGALSFTGTLVPFGLGVVAAVLYHDTLAMEGISLSTFGIYMGTALAITAFPMLARILHEKKLINTKIGALSLLAASVQDVISWILLSFVTAMAVSQSYSGGFVTLGGAFIFVLVVFGIIKPILKQVAKATEKTGELSQAHFAFILVLLLGAALATDVIGLYSVFGGFVLGLAIPRTSGIIDTLTVKLKDIVVVMFLPVFFAYSGLSTNLLVFQNPTIIIPGLVILLFSVVGKYGICTVTMKATGYTWRESSAIGGLINSRGLMELLIANIGLLYGVITQDLFSILVLMAIVTTLGAMPVYNLSMNTPKLRKQHTGPKVAPMHLLKNAENVNKDELEPVP
ncbi:cation:proton antiporter [Fulvivirga ulvae]|uniref:cation:proton antiporter domain-containing protein n=1 Tax=Fulvivirga ulvae TaxID=2904245 RepID=UPI001F399E8E|nr:cation:proton antiporter [Fulvivirga ulvae]UII31950.1 cation:proton antiporter [Fulvivirga ulvae]